MDDEAPAPWGSTVHHPSLVPALRLWVLHPDPLARGKHDCRRPGDLLLGDGHTPVKFDLLGHPGLQLCGRRRPGQLARSQRSPVHDLRRRGSIPRRQWSVSFRQQSLVHPNRVGQVRAQNAFCLPDTGLGVTVGARMMRGRHLVDDVKVLAHGGKPCTAIRRSAVCSKTLRGPEQGKPGHEDRNSGVSGRG